MPDVTEIKPNPRRSKRPAHILMPKGLEQQLPAIYSQDGLGDQAIVYAHYFTPGGSGDWYMTEYDPESREGFGLCVIQEAELGYISLAVLESIESPMGKLPVERDLYFSPKTMGEVREELRKRGVRA